MHEPLDKIRGEPNFQSLTNLKNQLKENAQTVETTLGGGQFGFLPLVIGPAQFALLSNVPFVAPQHPGPLLIPQGTTAHIARNMEQIHKSNLASYKSYVAINNALKIQISKAIEPEWLKPLKNPQTNSITVPVVQILEHLFDVHGNVTLESLTNRENAVKGMAYDPALEPIDNVFTAISDLVEFSQAANAPISQLQSIKMAYVILLNTRRFGQPITEWNRAVRANPNHNTWINFKTHFRAAHQELRETSDLLAVDTRFNSANFIQEITDAVTTRITDDIAEQLNLISTQAPPDEQVLPAPQQPAPAPVPPAQHANYVSQADMNQIMNQFMNVQQQTLAQMQQMVLNGNIPPQNGNLPPQNGNPPQLLPGGGPPPRRTRRRGGRGGRGGHGGRGNPQQQPQQQPHQQQQQQQQQSQEQQQQQQQQSLPQAYCWTHGYVHHHSNACRRPAQGHQNNATLQTRMNGSTYNVPQQFL